MYVLIPFNSKKTWKMTNVIPFPMEVEYKIIMLDSESMFIMWRTRIIFNVSNK